LRIKICGITNVSDAREAAAAGADAIGLNFVGGPRRIDGQKAGEIIRALPPLVTVVVLVQLEQGRIPADLRETMDELRICHLQLYGEYGGEDLVRLREEGFCIYPVMAVKDAGFADKVGGWLSGDQQQRPTGIVLDTFDPALKGGTGRAFRWDWVDSARQANLLANWPPIILAGGLNPDNVAEAVAQAQPYGVDVSSGVEKEGQPGCKDAQRMRDFVRNARRAAGE